MKTSLIIISALVIFTIGCKKEPNIPAAIYQTSFTSKDSCNKPVYMNGGSHAISRVDDWFDYTGATEDVVKAWVEKNTYPMKLISTHHDTVYYQAKTSYYRIKP